MLDNLTPPEREQEFFKFCVEEYLKYGSVDEVFKRHQYSLPISYPGFHRLIRNWGIIKAAGPNSKLSEAVAFLTCLSQQNIPLEKLYRSMPPSFQTSMSTMHRILHHVKEGVTRRHGTALVITPLEDPNSVLVANDISNPRIDLGKPFGSVSLPMGYSKGGEEINESVMRVIQQEVFTKEAVDKKVPKIIPDTITPFMYINIADVKVQAIHLTLPSKLCLLDSFSSFKLENHKFVNINQVAEGDIFGEEFRSGVVEIVNGYKEYRYNILMGEENAPIYGNSFLNQQLIDSLSLEVVLAE